MKHLRPPSLRLRKREREACRPIEGSPCRLVEFALARLLSFDMISGNELLPFSEVVANGVPKIVRTCIRRRPKSRIPETLLKPRVPQRFRYLHIETIDGFLGMPAGATIAYQEVTTKSFNPSC